MSRILFLSKRLYMGKDLVSDRYGRFRELPLELSRMGHKVQGLCLAYRPRPDGMVDDEGVRWHCRSVRRAVVPDLVNHVRAARALARTFRPDVVIAASDVFHAILGERVARGVGARSVIDLYDNFESFRGFGIPMIAPAFRRAVRHADLVSYISPPLSRRVTESYRRTGPVITVENGVKAGVFSPGSRDEARQRLGLPRDGILIGTAGALARDRDIETLFAAADLLALRNPQIALAVAGPRDEGLAWPRRARIHDLGMLDHHRVGDLFNALDVVVVANRDSTFGQYCHPQKAVEALACGTPVVLADVGSSREMFGDGCRFYPVSDPVGLAGAVESALAAPAPALDIADWGQLASRLWSSIDALGPAP